MVPLLLLLLALSGPTVVSTAGDDVPLTAGEPHRVEVIYVGEACRDAVRVLRVVHPDGFAVYAHAEPTFSRSIDVPDQDDPAACSAGRFIDTMRRGRAQALFDAFTGDGYLVDGVWPARDVPALCHHVGYEGGICLALDPRAGHRLFPLFNYGL